VREPAPRATLHAIATRPQRTPRLAPELRLALEDPDFSPERLLASSWLLLDALPVAR
jgi:hypothetical protein